MNRRKFIAIHTEIVEQWFVQRKADIRAAKDCTVCGNTPVWLSLAQAVTALDRPTAVLFDLVESGKLHCSLTREGHILICETSLTKFSTTRR